MLSQPANLTDNLKLSSIVENKNNNFVIVGQTIFPLFIVSAYLKSVMKSRL